MSKLALELVLLSICLTTISCSSNGSNPVNQPPPDPTSAFTISYLSASGGVSFSNSSQNASSYSWDFGDGSSSSETSPTKYYNADGTYTVTLTSFADNGKTAVSSQTVTINNIPYMSAEITGAGSGQFVATVTSASKSSIAIAVTGAISSYNESILISLPPNPTANTSYDISLGYPVGIVYTGPAGVFNADSQTPQSTGSILVTEISDTEIRGSFSCKVIHTSGNQSSWYIITNGEFYAKF